MASTVMGTGAAPAAAGRTRPIALTPVLLLACAIAVAALGGCASAPQGEHMVGGHRKITQEELTQRLMAFADRYIARISEATDQLENDATDPKVRDAMQALSDDYTKLLKGLDSGSLEPGLQDKIDTDATKIDDLCTIK